MEKVSIVITCFNDYQFVTEAVNSACAQTWQNKEIIVVDDGSDLRTKIVLDKLRPKIDQLLSQENKGVSVARNRGIFGSNGKYILILDSDDYFTPDFIEKAIPRFEDNDQIGIVCSHGIVEKSGKPVGGIIAQGGTSLDYLIKNRSLANNLLRKQCWDDVGGYDELMLNGYEDWEFNIRVRKNGWKIEVLDEFLFHYRLKDISRDQLANKNYKYELRNYIFLKHQDLFKDNFEEMITYMHNEMNRLEREKQKIQNSLTYKTGDFLISPFKKIWLWIRGIKNGKKVSYISKNSELP